MRNPCRKGETCKNQPGTYACLCEEGFVKTDGGCVWPGRGKLRTNVSTIFTPLDWVYLRSWLYARSVCCCRSCPANNMHAILFYEYLFHNGKQTNSWLNWVALPRVCFSLLEIGFKIARFDGISQGNKKNILKWHWFDPFGVNFE